MTKNNFTYYKLYRIVVNQLGTNAGCVHAIIANSSQGNHSCELAVTTIGNSLHLSYPVVSKMIILLLNAGFIESVPKKNRYGTKGYRYIPEKVEIELAKEDEKTLLSNDNRIKNHALNKKEFQNILTGNDMNRITVNNDMTQNVSSTDMIHIAARDESSHHLIPNVSSPDKNHVPIYNSKNINNYKQLLTPEISENVDFGINKKQKKTWRQAFEEKYNEPITNSVLEALSNGLDDSEETIDKHPNVLDRLPAMQHQVTDYEAKCFYDLVGVLPW